MSHADGAGAPSLQNKVYGQAFLYFDLIQLGFPEYLDFRISRIEVPLMERGQRWILQLDPSLPP
jgi:hypothetical protein